MRILAKAPLVGRAVPPLPHCASYLEGVLGSLLLCGVHHLYRVWSRKVLKDTDQAIEAAMAEIRAATADLATSTSVGVSRMMLRARLSATIVNAANVERAAEALRAVASEKALQGQTSLVPEGTGTVAPREAIDG